MQRETFLRMERRYGQPRVTSIGKLKKVFKKSSKKERKKEREEHHNRRVIKSRGGFDTTMSDSPPPMGAPSPVISHAVERGGIGHKLG